MAPSVLSWADQPTNERLLVELIMRESCWHGNPSVYPFNHSEQRFLLEHSLATTTEHWLLELSTWPSGATQFLTDKIHMGRFWIWTPFWMDIGNRRLWCLKNSAPRQIKGSNLKKKKNLWYSIGGERKHENLVSNYMVTVEITNVRELLIKLAFWALTHLQSGGKYTSVVFI